MGRDQAIKQRVLVPLFKASNPSLPVPIYTLMVLTLGQTDYIDID